LPHLDSDAIDDNEERKADEKKAVNGLVVNNDAAADYEAIDENSPNATAHTFSNSWKMNLILGLLCCWYAMSLTSWGAIANGGNIANPSAGDVSMWMVIASQWLMNALYLWTLIAARVFTDREFS